VLADDGAVWLLLDSAVPGPGDAPTLVLRRLSPTGAELAAWRLVGGSFEPYSLRLHPGRDGTVLLAGTVDGAAGVWTLDGDGVSAAHRFAGTAPFATTARFDRVAPDAAGGLLLRQGTEVLRLDEAGTEAGRFAVAALASWATWEGEARGRAVALLADSTGPATPQLVEALAHAHGTDAERAMERLFAAGPRAVDLLVAWRASHPSAGDGPGRRFRDDGGYGALADHLVDELMAADPDGFGQQVTSLLPTLDADLRERLVRPLVHGWPRPSAGFVALMEEWLTSDDDELASLGDSAFASTFQEDGDDPPRFPVSRGVFDHFLAELARLHESNLTGHDRFFFPRFPEVAVALDAVLADLEHPARPAVVAWLGELPHDLPPRRSARLWEAGPEPDLAVVRSLQRWAERWATADEPELATAAGFVARAAGAVVAAADGGEEKVAERVLSGPEPFHGWQRQAIGALYGRASDDVRAGLFARLAEPGLTPGARRAVADQFRHTAHGPAIDQEVVAAVATMPGLLDDLRGESDGALRVDFVAFLWQRLEERPALRRQLEAVFRDGCAAEAVAVERSVRDHDQGSAYFPTSCLRRSVESDVGRRVPAPLLAEHVALYRRPESFVRSNPWLPTLVEVEAKHGPLPGLAETIRRELLGAPEARVDAEALAVALGSELPAVFAEVAAMPVLDLAP